MQGDEGPDEAGNGYQEQAADLPEGTEEECRETRAQMKQAMVTRSRQHIYLRVQRRNVGR